MKKVSIIVPVYNMDQSLEKAVSSLLAQNYEALEVILVDDGSTDSSLQVCHKISGQDGRVKVVHTQNQGSGPARNIGIEMAAGDYVYFPDADDYIEPDAIEVLVNAMESGHCDLVVFGYRVINVKGKVISIRAFPNMAVEGAAIRGKYQQYKIGAAPWNKLFDLGMIKRHNILYPALRRHQDVVFIARYIAITERVGFVDKVFYSYHLNDFKKEWEKYPVDYIDNVIDFRHYHMEAVDTWNPKNQAKLNTTSGDYINNIVKAMELSFGKKMNFNKQQRLSWLKEVMEREEIQKACASEVKPESRYLSKICSLVRAGELNSLYWTLSLKVFVKVRMNWLIDLKKRLTLI